MLPDLAFRITAQAMTAAAFAKTRTELRGIRGEIAAIGAGARSFAGAFIGGVGIAGILGAARAVNSIVQEVGHLGEVADRIGLTTDQLQELHYAAKLADVSTEDLATSMQMFSKNVGIASTGTGDLAKVLKLNGIAIRDQDGHVRSVNDLLHDYADLIKNAGSEEEKLTLAAYAFGKAGGYMVNVLNDGSAGLTHQADEAHRLNQVLGEELVRKMDEVGDDWTRVTAVMEVNFKNFVVGSIAWIDELHDAAKARGDAIKGFLGGLFGDGSGGVDRPAPGSATPKTVADLDRAVGGKTNPAIAAAAAAAAKTKLPSTPDAGEASAQKQFENVREALKLEADQLDRTAREQEIYNALARAGTTIDTERGQIISGLAGALYDEKEAQKALNDEVDFFSQVAYDAFADLIKGGASFEEVLLRLIERLAEAALQAALLGQGPLAGAFGTGASGGAFGSVAKAVIGAFTGSHAAGGFVPPGRWGTAGEEGTEAIFGGRSGVSVFPHGSGGGSIVNVHNYGAAVSQRQRKSSDGRNILDIIIQLVKGDMAEGGFDGVLQGRFGNRPLSRRMAGT